MTLALVPMSALAAGESARPVDRTQHWVGYVSLLVIVLAYVAAMLEDVTMLRKSKPMILGASLVWFLIVLTYRRCSQADVAVAAFKGNLQSYMELLLFIMVSMTFLNAMQDMQLFAKLRNWLVGARLGYRKLFWITGILVFLLSSVINGLTTGLLMGAVVTAVGKDNPRFVTLACINIVVVANAGGSLSPLGGISTLFVWQKGVVEFTQFSTLFIPCLVASGARRNAAITAALASAASYAYFFAPPIFSLAVAKTENLIGRLRCCWWPPSHRPWSRNSARNATSRDSGNSRPECCFVSARRSPRHDRLLN